MMLKTAAHQDNRLGTLADPKPRGPRGDPRGYHEDPPHVSVTTRPAPFSDDSAATAAAPSRLLGRSFGELFVVYVDAASPPSYSTVLKNDGPFMDSVMCP